MRILRVTLLTIAVFQMRVLPVSAQQVRNLIFEGAGVRGIAYAGVIAELERRRMMDSVSKVGGTSAGSGPGIFIQGN